MNAQEAQTFTHMSEAHIALLIETAVTRGCSCAPYVDWFTYNRWQAQNMQVQKGEGGVKLTTYITKYRTNKETGEKESVGKRPKVTSVFCRCQVKEKS